MQRIHVLAAVLAAAVLVAAPFARGAAPNVVISQVYAGGGNAGATYTNDFVELLNRGGSAVDLSGWTVQYASAASASWQTTALSGTLQPGRYYLVQLASTASVGSPLPAPDATGTSNLAASGGKVALVHDATALTCGASLGSCAAAVSVEDLVGYGSATDYEGSGAAPALTSSTAAVRAGGGCTDTDANAADFAAAAPTPRTTASAAASCSGSTTTTGTTASAGVDVDVQPLLSIALERPAISFGTVFAGQVPPPISERLTVVSNNPAGYVVAVHRTAFTPADLPLGIAATPAGTLAPVPVAPTADLLLVSTSAATSASGDVVPAAVGFSAPLPAVSPGHYTSTLTFTVVGR